VGEVVHAELRLETIGGCRLGYCHDACVVDQDVEFTMAGCEELGSECADGS
jgi:hypothetical protein